jgi:orotate phosphoribosyltransferase
MDETTKSLIDSIIVQFDKPTKLPSGHVCTVFYDTLRLTPNDLARLAAQAVGHLPNDAFDVAVGIAYDGIFFSAAIAGGRLGAILQTDNKIYGPSMKDRKVIVVGDVVLTGQHLYRAQEVVEQHGGQCVGYACIVDRSNGSVGTANRPLWSAYQTSMV